MRLEASSKHARYQIAFKVAMGSEGKLLAVE